MIRLFGPYLTAQHQRTPCMLELLVRQPPPIAVHIYDGEYSEKQGCANEEVGRVVADIVCCSYRRHCLHIEESCDEHFQKHLLQSLDNTIEVESILNFNDVFA